MLRKIVLSVAALASLCFVLSTDAFGQNAPVLWNPSLPSAWSYRFSLTSGPAEATVAHGGIGDVPIMGDFDGDGVDEIGIVRRDGGTGNWTWFMSGTNTGYEDDAAAGFVRTPFAHGSPDGPFFDIPIVGDWDGDGVDTAGLVRRAPDGDMRWILTNNRQAGGAEIPFFENGCHDVAVCNLLDVPVVGDWDGDGIDTVNLIRQNSDGNKRWILTNSQYSAGSGAGSIFHGAFDQNRDLHVVGDWNGDGADSIGIYRRPEARWYLWSDLNTPNDIQFNYGTGQETVAFGAALEPPDPPPPPIDPAGLGNYGRAVLASGPVAYWRMEENADPARDWADAAGTPQQGAQNGRYKGVDPLDLGQAGPRPGDLIGGLPALGFSAANQAAHFQGNTKGSDDVVLAADDGTLNAARTLEFSLEVWVKGAGLQEPGAAIIAKGEGRGGEQYAIDVASGAYRFYVWHGGMPTVIASTTRLDDSWQHVVAVFDQAAGEMKIYVNGVEEGSTAPPASIIDNLHDVSIGSRRDEGSALYNLNFAGLIDEVAIYNRALSPGEIQAHFSAAAVPEPSAIALVAMGALVALALNHFKRATNPACSK